MSVVEAVKYLIRSRSWRFMRDRKRQHAGFAGLRWRGYPIHYRPGSIDTELIYRDCPKPPTSPRPTLLEPAIASA